MGLGLGGLFLEGEDPVVVADHCHAALFQPRGVRLIVAHDAGGALFLRVGDELRQREIQHVVAGDDQHFVVQIQRIDGELHVLHRAEAGFVGGGAVVHHGDLLGLGLRPVDEVGRVLVVGDDHVFIHHAEGIDVVHQPVEDGLLAHLQQRLGEVFGQRIQAGGIARGENQTFHVGFLTARRRRRFRRSARSTCPPASGRSSDTFR